MESINYPEYTQDINSETEMIDFNNQLNSSINNINTVVSNITSHIEEQVNNIFKPKLKGYQVRNFNGQTIYSEISNQGLDINQILQYMSQNQKPQKISFYLENPNTNDNDVKEYLCMIRYNPDTDSFDYENFWNHTESEFNKIKEIVKNYFQI